MKILKTAPWHQIGMGMMLWAVIYVLWVVWWR
jgi:hypothetical protein